MKRFNLYLEERQIAFLRQQESASAFIRKLIDENQGNAGRLYETPEETPENSAYNNQNDVAYVPVSDFLEIERNAITNYLKFCRKKDNGLEASDE